MESIGTSHFGDYPYWAFVCGDFSCRQQNPRLQQSEQFCHKHGSCHHDFEFLLRRYFATWQVITGALLFKLYATYMVALFLVLHAKTLMDVDALYDKVKPYVYANYVFMLLVGMLILGVVYVDNSWSILNGLYGGASWGRRQSSM